MWYWFTNKIHEWLLFISIIIVLGLVFFPDPTRNLAGLGTSNIKPAFELAVYFSQGILDIVRGIADAMFT
jgi:uncharacterized membrane protein